MFMSFTLCIFVVFVVTCAYGQIVQNCEQHVIIKSDDFDSGTHNYFSAAHNSIGFRGSLAVVGAMYQSDMEYQAGAAYVFTEGEPGDWVQSQIIYPPVPSAEHKFGVAVALSDDSSTIFVGAAYTIYMYTESSPGVWAHSDDDSPSGDVSFGSSIHTHGDSLVVGAWLEASGDGAAYFYKETSPQVWTFAMKISGEVSDRGAFGSSFASRPEDNVMMINAYNSGGISEYGRVHVYDETSTGVWTQIQILQPAARGNKDLFGKSVAMAGNIASMGSNAIGSAFDGSGQCGRGYIFTEEVPGTWTETVSFYPSDAFPWMEFGHATGIWDGTALFSAIMDGTGSVYQYSEITPGVWEQAAKFTSDGQGRFGKSIYISGSKVMIGSENDDIYFMDFGDADQCIGHACENGGTCVDVLYGYCCDCPKSHADGNLCQDCMCENGGVCENDLDTGEGYCDCTNVTYSGVTCQKFCNNGLGETYPDTGCNCTLSGATGKFCTDDVDDCLSNPCANDGACSDYGAILFPNHNNEFNCSCDGTGHVGLQCDILPCNISAPCFNGGTCMNDMDFNGIAISMCNCTNTGYEGEFCETDVDECAVDPSPCNAGACINLVSSFTCDCTGSGRQGLFCTDDIDDCASSPCLNDGVCKDKGANKFQCNCDEFWEGDTCSDNIDDCPLKGYYCENGAACTDDPVNVGDVMCDCSVSEGEFTGKYCNVPIEDACVTFNPCANGGKCLYDDNAQEMSCDCDNTGYEGDVCDVQVYVSECVSSPCLNEGQCYDPSDQEDDWYCECTTGYTGAVCDTILLSPCDSSPCENNGECTYDDVTLELSCTCTENFVGDYCSTFLNANMDSSSSSPDAGDQLGNTDSLQVDLTITQICSSQATALITMVSLGGSMVLLMLIWTVLRKFPYFANSIKQTPKFGQRAFFLMMLQLSIFALVADVSFVGYVSSECASDLSDVNAAGSIGGAIVGVSGFLNISILFYLINQDPKRTFTKHCAKHMLVSAVIVALAMANLSVALLLDSNILGLRAFTGNFPASLKKKIKSAAIGTALIQHAPQLVNKLRYGLGNEDMGDTVTLIATLASGFFIMLNLIRFMWITCDLLGTKEEKVPAPGGFIDSELTALADQAGTSDQAAMNDADAVMAIHIAPQGDDEHEATSSKQKSPNHAQSQHKEIPGAVE